MAKSQTIIIQFLVFTVILLLVISIVLEMNGFSNIFDETLDSPQVEYVVENKENNANRVRLPKPSANNNKNMDWFDSAKWIENDCPYIENICISEQRFHVFNNEDLFSLSNQSKYMRNELFESQTLFQNMFNASKWDTKQYKAANCYYSEIENHILIGTHYQTMLREWYVTTLAHLFYIFNYSQSVPSQYGIDTNVQFYLFIGDQIELTSFHHLFIHPFTKHSLRPFSYLFQRIPCQCYTRLIFCGFRKFEADTDQQTYVEPMTQIIQSYNVSNMRQTFPEMITFYNGFIEKWDVNIESDIIKWKYQTLTSYVSEHNLNISVEISDMSTWKFIGMSQDFIGQKWLGLHRNVMDCNEKYLREGIFCFELYLNDHYHPRDIVIMHKSFTILIGSRITNGIWMHLPNENHKFVIELVPTNESNEAVVFAMSQINHIVFGLKSEPTSIKQFKVHWHRLQTIIDYLLVNTSEYCNGFSIPTSKDENLKVYNGYCAF